MGFRLDHDISVGDVTNHRSSCSFFVTPLRVDQECHPWDVIQFASGGRCSARSGAAGRTITILGLSQGCCAVERFYTKTRGVALGIRTRFQTTTWVSV